MAYLETNIPAVSDDTKAKKGKSLADLEKKLLMEVDQSEMGLIARARENLRLSIESRRRYDWEWLARDLFRRGYQFSRYNPATRTVIMATSNSTKIPINITASAMRVIKNQVVAFRPKWEVLPNNLDDESKDNARYSGKLLDYVYIKSRLRKHVKELIGQGLLFSVGGPWQIGWDDDFENEDGTKGFVFIWPLDPFDFYIDPNCTDGVAFSDAEYVVKCVRRSLREVKNNPKYQHTELISRGDMKLAQSEYKQFLLTSLKYMGQMQTTPESETIIVKEGYFKEHDDKGKVKMRHLIWVDACQFPLFNELLDDDDFPFRMYQADPNPLEVYGEGWARHVIPVNRVLNALESSIFDYNYRYSKGRLVIDKNSGIRVVTNEHGSIIEKNRGADIHSLPLQPLPQQAEGQVMRMRQYFEDLSGAHDVSLGRIPVGVKSGIGIAELKQADATNQDDLVDNLEDFLVEVAKKVLKIVSEKVTFPRLVKATNIAGKSDYFVVVGAEGAKTRAKNKKTYKIGGTEYPMAVITPNNTITVQIGSWLAYSKQQRQQELKDLFTQGVIDQRTLLEHLEFGDVDQIVERTRMEALMKKHRDVQQLGPNEVTDEEVAISENDMLLQGDTRVTALPTDNHQVHIGVHDQYRTNKLVAAHINEHSVMEATQKAAQRSGAGVGQIGNQMDQLTQMAQSIPPEILAAGIATGPNAPQGAPGQAPPMPPMGPGGAGAPPMPPAPGPGGPGGPATGGGVLPPAPGM